MKSTTCRAAVCYKFNEPLVIEEVTLEPTDKGEVKVRNAATSVCHSDIHAINGEHGVWPLPGIAGHEICGYVDEIGEGVTHVKVGDLVIVTLVPAGCGKCYYCSIGDPGHCQNYPGNLHPPGKYVNKNGTRLTQLVGLLGGFAEYTTVPEVYVVKIPDDFPVDRAALIACGVISGFGAVVNRAKVQPNRSVVVMGTGGVGLNAIQGASFSGAYPIIAIDISDSKLEVSKEFGATHTINAKEESDPVKKVWDLTYGRGADNVIIAVAGIDIMRQGFLMSSCAGTTVVVGHGWDERLTAFTPIDFMSGRTLTGSAMGAVNSRIDIPRMIELYKSGIIKLDELISGHYSFDQINEAIESMEEGNAIRNIIMF